LAAGRCALEHHYVRRLLVKAEIDEIGGVEDLQIERCGLHRLLERQGKAQRQELVRTQSQEIIDGRAEVQLLAVHLGKGEIGIFLERRDIDLGQRLKLFAGEDAW